jgi:hypothetical protein
VEVFLIAISSFYELSQSFPIRRLSVKYKNLTIMTHVNNGGILMEIGEGNQHFDVIYILQISMRNV